MGVSAGDAGEEVAEAAGGVVLHAGQHALIRRHGEGRVGVTEAFGDDLDRHPVTQQEAGVGVADVVKRDRPRTASAVDLDTLEEPPDTTHEPSSHPEAQRLAWLMRELRETKCALRPNLGAMGPPISVVDVFTDREFRGNPAAICRLDGPVSEDWMQAVAAEMNQPMTAFVVARHDGDHDLRWFTPTTEVEICGHATLAAAHVLGGERSFQTSSGLLACRPTDDGGIEMDFPAIPVQPLDDADDLAAELGVDPTQVLGAWAGGEWWVVELSAATEVPVLEPHRDALLLRGGVVVVFAAPGDRDDVDSICRVFEPASGIDEDPVTGSAHCVIGPLLAQRTSRNGFRGEQASPRGGRVAMEVRGDRVILRGSAVTVLDGALQCSPRSV